MSIRAPLNFSQRYTHRASIYKRSRALGSKQDVLIIGGSGRVGSSTAKELLSSNDQMKITIAGRNRYLTRLSICEIDWFIQEVLYEASSSTLSSISIVKLYTVLGGLVNINIKSYF